MPKPKCFHLKKKKKKNSILFVENGSVYDIYSGKLCREEDIFDKDKKMLKDEIRKKYS